MNCPYATAPKDEELVSCVLDEEPLSERAKEHLEQCAICQRRLARYRRINRLLLAWLYRSQCPSVTELNHYCAGLLPPDDTITIVHHLHDCPLCTQEVEEIRRVLSDFDPFFMPTITLPLYTKPYRTIASFVPQQPSSMMHEADAERARCVWPRRYRAEALYVSLHLSSFDGERFMLLGILSAIDHNASDAALEGCGVDLFHVSEAQNLADEDGIPPFMTRTIDALSTVVFMPLPAGTYIMVVHAPAGDIVIPALAIECS